MFLSQSWLDPNNDALFEPGGGGTFITASGTRVSPDQAMMLTAVFACVRAIAEAFISMPLHLYKRSGRSKERAIDHPLYNVLHRTPNPWQTSSEWKGMCAAHIALRGNAYNEIVFGPNGDIKWIIPRHPDHIDVMKLPDGRGLRYVFKPGDGSPDRTIPQEMMLHFRGLSVDGCVGLNPIEYEREAIGYAIASQQYGARFYKNGATMPGVIEMPGNFRTKDDRQSFQESWNRAQTGSNLFKTPILEYNMKYHELGIKHTDMQYLETLKYRDVDTARIFRVPPHKIGILDRATWKNIEQQAIEFVTDVLLPGAVQQEERMNMTLLLETEVDEYFIKYSLQGLLRGDSIARSQYYKNGITDGWLMRNEARELEDLNPIDGLDEPLTPMNMQQGDEQARDDAESGDDGESEGDGASDAQDGEDTGDEERARATAVVTAAAGRVATKEINALTRIVERYSHGSSRNAAIRRFFDAKHERIIAESLGINTDEAKANVAAVRGYALANDLEQILGTWRTERVDNLLNVYNRRPVE